MANTNSGLTDAPFVPQPAFETEQDMALARLDARFQIATTASRGATLRVIGMTGTITTTPMAGTG